MPPRKPWWTGRQLVTALEAFGFEVQRQRGSHVVLRHPDGRTTVVPVHRGEVLGPGLLGKILRDVDLTAARIVAGPP